MRAYCLHTSAYIEASIIVVISLPVRVQVYQYPIKILFQCMRNTHCGLGTLYNTLPALLYKDSQTTYTKEWTPYEIIPLHVVSKTSTSYETDDVIFYLHYII